MEVLFFKKKKYFHHKCFTVTFMFFCFFDVLCHKFYWLNNNFKPAIFLLTAIVKTYYMSLYWILHITYVRCLNHLWLQMFEISDREIMLRVGLQEFWYIPVTQFRLLCWIPIEASEKFWQSSWAIISQLESKAQYDSTHKSSEKRC